MKLGYVLFGILLIIPFIQSQNITLDYPSEVYVNEKFEIKLSLIDFAEDNYDVKIDILNGQEKRICKILNNGEWKSTYYFVNEVIKQDENKEIELNCEEDGYANFYVKLKDSKEKSVSFGSYEIKIKEQEKQNQEEDSEEDSNQSFPQEESNEDLSEDLTPTGNLVEKISEQNKSVIKLNSKSIKSQEDDTKLTKNNYAIYALIGFCILLGFLFLLKKIKRKNEFN